LVQVTSKYSLLFGLNNYYTVIKTIIVFSTLLIEVVNVVSIYRSPENEIRHSDSGIVGEHCPQPSEARMIYDFTFKFSVG
jgi:hypothetical protein